MTLGVFAAALMALALIVGCQGPGARRRPVFGTHVEMPHPATTATDTVVRDMSLGRSLLGRPLIATEIRSGDSRKRILVVGCIHGNEPAGIGIAELLEDERATGADVWTVENLNPDGVVIHTRQNAEGVDLNRNFPFAWQPLGHRGDQQYSGPAPLSEPESRAAYALIERIRPAITIWFHQPLALVDESGGNLAVEHQYASLVGLPLRHLIRYPGSAASWQNNTQPGGTAFVVELPPGPLSSADAERYADAVVGLV